MKKFATACSLVLLSACGQSGEDDDGTASAEVVAGYTGAFIETQGDGTRFIAYASESGAEYSALMDADSEGTWAVENEKLCLTYTVPSEVHLCMTFAAVDADGNMQATLEADGQSAHLPMQVVSASVDPGTVPPLGAGAYLIGGSTLLVLTPDGKAVDGDNVVTGTWRVDGDQRCYTGRAAVSPTEEDCSTPGAPAADGTIPTTNFVGSPITVTLLD